jgi:hypothetical protein
MRTGSGFNSRSVTCILAVARAVVKRTLVRCIPTAAGPNREAKGIRPKSDFADEANPFMLELGAGATVMAVRPETMCAFDDPHETRPNCGRG